MRNIVAIFLLWGWMVWPLPTNADMSPQAIMGSVGKRVSVSFVPAVDPTKIGLTFQATVTVSNLAVLMPIQLTSPHGCNGAMGIPNILTSSYIATWACVESRYLTTPGVFLSFLGRMPGVSDVTFSDCSSDEQPIACPRNVRIRIRR